eukprot:gnl/MRDRNA2_/MRDRNA2_49120_c0_seq1.p1 gnl/MRDRNA2_/MRDRNA2_49120_c0~~gnl/MRDRNA2_/MRDRNA2_49120_c0_seq1.p1  ORF type:complete len:321 (+),score=42.46 gnl/MRDRNA2_/MRDRNA2_49120_c0_seq1:3-965(+)
MEVYPHNAAERGFSVAVLLFALIFFSSFLSSITMAMTSLRNLNSDSSRQFSLLRRFLKQRNVTQELSTRITQYLELRVMAHKKIVQERDVAILAFLSEPLHKELKEQEHKPVLIRHPFFQHYCNSDDGAMRSLCQQAIKNIFVSEGDTVFKAGDKCENMYFVVDGHYLYSWQGENSGASDSPEKNSGNGLSSSSNSCKMIAYYKMQRTQKRATSPLRKGDWVSEACLWAHFLHAGTMIAVEMCNLLAINAGAFATITSKTGNILPYVSKYADKYVEEFNSLTPSDGDLAHELKDIERMCEAVFEVEGGQQLQMRDFTCCW